MIKKYKKGYTTGVFDLFHIGHLNILREAKKHCDYLVVGVSTDELVQEYKNKTPIISYDERSEIVKAIQYTDEVVPQKSRDKLKALEELEFDVMFVGDDWKGSSFFEDIEKKMKQKGVDIVYFPYTKGTSSTIIRQVLNQKINK